MGRIVGAFCLPAAGAAASTALAALLTAGTPGYKETLLLHGTCATTGMLVAGVIGMKIFAGGNVRMFGKKEAAAGNPEPKEQVQTSGTGDNDRVAVPVRVAQDAAAALAGIKSLIESLQVTDRQTWEKVAALAGQADAALQEMRAGLDAVAAAADRAMEAFRGIAALVEGR